MLGLSFLCPRSREHLFWVFLLSFVKMHRGEDVERQLAGWLKMERVNTPDKNVFSGLGYVQHAWHGWAGRCGFLYHTYIVLKGVWVRNSVESKYDAGLGKIEAEETITASVSALSDRMYGAE